MHKTKYGSVTGISFSSGKEQGFVLHYKTAYDAKVRNTVINAIKYHKYTEVMD